MNTIFAQMIEDCCYILAIENGKTIWYMLCFATILTLIYLELCI